MRKRTPLFIIATALCLAACSRSSSLHKIDFDLDGGNSPSYKGPQVVETITDDLFFFDCVKPNYVFKGWSYQNEKIFDEKGNKLAEFNESNEMTFLALYSDTVKLDITSNMPEAGTITGAGEYHINSNVVVTAHPYDGYKFDGWYLDNKKLSDEQEFNYSIRMSDVTLEARFKTNEYPFYVELYNPPESITVLTKVNNCNYVTDHVDIIQINYKDSVTVSVESSSDTEFLGWYSPDECVSNSEEFTFIMPNHNYSLVAKWDCFVITYELYGGTNNPDNPTTYKLNDGTIHLSSPTRDGYDFQGWMCNGEIIDHIDSQLIENVTLEAIWELHTYAIIYHLNGGTNNANNPTTYTIDSSTITLLNPTRNGYTFNGWFKDALFTNKIEKIYAGSFGNVEVYAKWTVIVYSIDYILDGGTLPEPNPITYSIESSFELKPAVKTGYTFITWFDIKKQKEISSISVGTTGDLILSARYNDGNEYLVTLNPNGGEVSETSVSVKFDKPYSLPIPSKTGYIFDGWYDDNNILIQNEGSWEYDTIETLVAHWTAVTYSIDYILNGGTLPEPNPITYSIESSFELKPAVKTGYTFLGWFDAVGNQITSVNKGTTGNLILYARWNDGDCFVVTLDPYFNDMSCTSLNVQFDHPYSLPVLTKTGYIFEGWYDGTTQFANSGNWVSDSDKTLVAHWTAITYSIDYILNGGSLPEPNPIAYSIESSFLLKDPVKPGYSFVGWYDDNNDLVTSIQSGTTGNLTLTAHWSANLNSLLVLSSDVEKGSVSILSGTGYSGENITVEATPCDNCIFKGWYCNNDKISDETLYSFVMPINDYVLIARFVTLEEQENEEKRLGIRPDVSDDGKTVTYGLYPQTQVTDSSIIESLESIENPESNGWYLFNDEYYTTTSSRRYWYKCSLITWTVLSNNEGKMQLLSNVLLDATWYYVTQTDRKISGTTIYPDNYRYSNIRAWLNGYNGRGYNVSNYTNKGFYDVAFNLGDSYIQTTEVDNSPSTANLSSSNDHFCQNTFDKVFLLSYADYKNGDYGFPNANYSSNKRYCKVTDWAKVSGSFSNENLYNMNAQYWTRTPIGSVNSECYIITTLGATNVAFANSRYTGVRPTIIIQIS